MQGCRDAGMQGCVFVSLHPKQALLPASLHLLYPCILVSLHHVSRFAIDDEPCELPQDVGFFIKT